MGMWLLIYAVIKVDSALSSLLQSTALLQSVDAVKRWVGIKWRVDIVKRWVGIKWRIFLWHVFFNLFVFFRFCFVLYDYFAIASVFDVYHIAINKGQCCYNRYNFCKNTISIILYLYKLFRRTRNYLYYRVHINYIFRTVRVNIGLYNWGVLYSKEYTFINVVSPSPLRVYHPTWSETTTDVSLLPRLTWLCKQKYNLIWRQQKGNIVAWKMKCICAEDIVHWGYN